MKETPPLFFDVFRVFSCFYFKLTSFLLSSTSFLLLFFSYPFQVTKFGRTLLHETAARDMPSASKALLLRNVPAHSEDPDGTTPLHEAARAGSDKVVKLLIDRGAALDAQVISTGRTPLHEAALSGDGKENVRITTLLMEAGARIDLKDKQGKTPWRLALTKNHQAVAKILRTSMRGRFEAEEVALTAQTAGVTKEKQEEIMSLARVGNVSAIENHLDHNVPVNLQISETGESLLMAAASSGNLSLVEMLFRKGAKADLEDIRGRNAVHYGCKYPKIGSTVAMRGANLSMADTQTGKTALHLCAAEGHVFDDIMRDLHVKPDVFDNSGQTPLHLASEQGRTAAVTKLIALGANVGLAIETSKKTPLHLAASTIHGMDAMRVLVDAGASVTTLDNRGRLPLHYAAECGSAGNILILCEAIGGTKDINTLDGDGYSSVHIACMKGKLGALRALITKGGDATFQSSKGIDGVGLALEAGRISDTIVNFLTKKKQLLTNVDVKYGLHNLSPIHLVAK
jgi:ankyrin repeat protein